MTTSIKLTRVFLQLRLWLLASPPAILLGILLLVTSSSAWLLWTPYLKQTENTLTAQQRDAQQSLHQVNPNIVAPPLSVSEKRLRSFYESLGETRYVEQQVKTFFAFAAENGLSLDQAEYKLASDENGQFDTYTIILPVKGQYQAIRQFCDHILQFIPFASLDEIHFKKENVAASILTATLRFTLYLHPDHRLKTTVPPIDTPPGDPS